MAKNRVHLVLVLGGVALAVGIGTSVASVGGEAHHARPAMAESVASAGPDNGTDWQ